jgi:hypothetical protein
MNILSLVNQNLDIFYQIQTKCYRNSDTVFFSSIHRTKRGLGMTMSVDPDRGVSGACTQQPQPTGKKIACKQYAACRRGNIAWMAYACLSSFSVDVVGARMDDSARLELKHGSPKRLQQLNHLSAQRWIVSIVHASAIEATYAQPRAAYRLNARPRLVRWIGGEKHCIRIPVAFRLYLIKII